MGAAFGLITGWLLLAALTGLVGALAGHFLIVPGAAHRRPSLGVEVDRRAASMGLMSAVLLIPVLGAVFWRQLAEFRDPFVPWTEDARLLLGATSWGVAWMLAVIASVLAAGGCLSAPRRRAGWWMAGVAAVGLATFPAFTGHAASASTGMRPLTLAADVLHVLGAGAWLGGLGLILVVDRANRGGPAATDGSVLADLVAGFSPVALVSVGTLTITGVFAAWVQLPEISALVTTPYGRLLAVKVLLASVAFGLGAWNWRRLTPRLLRPEGPAGLRRTAALEILVAQGVLAVTAILVRTSPPVH